MTQKSPQSSTSPATDPPPIPKPHLSTLLSDLSFLGGLEMMCFLTKKFVGKWEIVQLRFASKWMVGKKNTPLKTEMTMENPPFEEVSPIENSDFPLPYLFSVWYFSLLNPTNASWWFQPIWKILDNLIISPSRGENKKKVFETTT